MDITGKVLTNQPLDPAEVKQKAEKIVYLNFLDNIDLIKVNRFMAFTLDVIRTHQPTELYYFISSNGGEVDAGFTLYNFLISLHSQITITMHNIGTIDSIANVIFIAGQKRYAAPSASFLFHGVAMNFQAGGFGRTMLTENLSRLDAMEKRIANTIHENSQMTSEEITLLFHQGEGKDVNFDLSKQIISEIKPPSVPAGSIHLVMNFV